MQAVFRALHEPADGAAALVKRALLSECSCLLIGGNPAGKVKGDPAQKAGIVGRLRRLDLACLPVSGGKTIDCGRYARGFGQGVTLGVNQLSKRHKQEERERAKHSWPPPWGLTAYGLAKPPASRQRMSKPVQVG